MKKAIEQVKEMIDGPGNKEVEDADPVNITGNEDLPGTEINTNSLLMAMANQLEDQRVLLNYLINVQIKAHKLKPKDIDEINKTLIAGEQEDEH